MILILVFSGLMLSVGAAAFACEGFEPARVRAYPARRFSVRRMGGH